MDRDRSIRFVTGPDPCAYLPDRAQSMEYVIRPDLDRATYEDLMRNGWRRFGRSTFRPVCAACRACRSLRVDVGRFRPNRSQRRVRARNEGQTLLRVGEPELSGEVLALFDRYHAHQAESKDWPESGPGDFLSFHRSFLDNPFPTLEYRYIRDGAIRAIGYVDELADSFSAIYCFYDPDALGDSPGTWNVLSAIERAASRGVPYVYLGYYVEGCRSLEYKRKFAPNQVHGPDGWRDFTP